MLAAGKGTRMRSALPKVLHRAAGRPLLGWVLDAARAAGCARLLVVVGHGAERVRAAFAGEAGHAGGASDTGDGDNAGGAGERGGDITWVMQEEQRGTGHALAQAAGLIDGPAQLLVLSGDVPLVTAATLERLLAAAAASGWGAMAVADLPRPGGLGRVIAQPGGAALERIVEAADALPAELAITLVNAGLYVLPAPEIFSYLAGLVPANAQRELYLTEALNAAAAAGCRIALVGLDDPREALGVNDRRELAAVRRRLRVGPDTVPHPDVSLLGHTGDEVAIEPYSVLDGAAVAGGCRVGPFARLGPASRLLPGPGVGIVAEGEG